MKSETREKDVNGVDEMVARNFKFIVLDSSKEYIAEMPKVMSR